MKNRLAFLTILVITLPLGAQERAPSGLTAADYMRAERTLRGYTTPLVLGASVRPTWVSGERFWYQNLFPLGLEFVVVDADAGTRARAFDHAGLSRALSSVTGENYDDFQLPFAQFEFIEGGRSISFELNGRSYVCDIRGERCAERESESRVRSRFTVTSPDGSAAVFIRDHNLWVRDLGTGDERPLTTDGVEDYGYATDNAGWTRSDRPVVLWSPDSKKIATFQQDQRGVGEMYLVDTKVGHSTLQAWKYPLPGDTVIPMIERVVVHLDGPRVVRLDMPPDEHRSTICDHVICRGGGWADVEWSSDGSHLAFVSSSRDHKRAQLRIADPTTGAIRDVMEETVETFFESGKGMVNWHVLPETNEVIWFSQRDDWGHLYLYDLGSGRLKSRITEGNWNVLQVRRVDREARTLYFTGVGLEPGDPYFEYFYRVGLDGGDLTLLSPDSANHVVTMSPSGSYFVDSYSTPVVPAVTVVRSVVDGKALLTLEESDISRLVESGWQPPIPIQVKARDGVTDIHGLMYRPTGFDPERTYPILNYLYPGPQAGSVGSRSFNPSRGDKQALAELGFIVVEVDAMGTPGRSKSFHEAYYGNMGDNGIPDQMAAIAELAERYPWMDLDRVGIWGHSGGGFAAANAIMRYPDFYKVAVSQAGNHDNRNYEDDWGEKWQGLLETYSDGTTNYDNQANQLLVENLKGKLLLAHGTMDSNVPPSNTLLVVDRLIAANKDFDLIMLPNRSHGFGNEPYMMRRRWDYFVRHLLGVEPPEGYEIGKLEQPIS